jgi:hypothetical protein
MRNIAIMMIGGILGVLTLLIVMTITGRSDRKMELCDVLPSVAETSLAEGMYDSSDELIATVVSNLSVLLDSESDLRLNLYGIDTDKGLLALKVTEEYRQPNGSMGKVSSERAVIADRTDENETADEGELCQVRFFIDDDLYKAYCVREGDTISDPASPYGEGGTFAGWTDDNGYLADFSEPIMQDRDYFAMWE